MESFEIGIFRTFYSRVYEYGLGDVHAVSIRKHTYKEHFPDESLVVPNLSLSLKDIFERWKRNQPLDDIKRNGQFYLTKPMTDEEEDEILERESEVDCIEDVATELSAINGASRDATLFDDAQRSGAEDGVDIAADAQG